MCNGQRNLVSKNTKWTKVIRLTSFWNDTIKNRYIHLLHRWFFIFWVEKKPKIKRPWDCHWYFFWPLMKNLNHDFSFFLKIFIVLFVMFNILVLFEHLWCKSDLLIVTHIDLFENIFHCPDCWWVNFVHETAV